ncbi:MAG: N-acetylmuramoyl-L-alanine amidase [Bacteroidales bacterium]|nr:N-acetylmuramoyl-L-alanine amidase [Candidatus Latescibacterota bacterium]
MMQIPYVSDWPVGEARDRRVNEPVEGAIVHSMAEWIILPDGKKSFAPAFLTSLNLEVHGIIATTGTVVEWIPPTKIADHAGESEFGGRTMLNKYFLGCEFLVSGAHTYATFLEAIKQPDCYTQQQYRSGGYWYASKTIAYPTITKATIVAHSLVSSDAVRGEGRGKVDPGPGFDWEQLWYWYDKYLIYLKV